MALTKPQVAQLRYYGIGNNKNIPKETDDYKPWGGEEGKSTDLLENYGPVVKLGVQSLPGTRFFINSLSNGIILDHTGIYELDLTNTNVVIPSLQVDANSLKRISDTDNAALIIDILYYGENTGGHQDELLW